MPQMESSYYKINDQNYKTSNKSFGFFFFFFKQSKVHTDAYILQV